MTTRASYHHGRLKQALVDEAVRGARAGGESAVGLNRLASAVGVSASAAYRHFPGGLDELLVAVGDVGRRELAERIVLRTGEVPASRDPQVNARRRFRASGQAYVEYVLEEPGLFQVACRHEDAAVSDGGPFRLLEDCIDNLVSTGVLPRERRRHAATAAWAAVHGVAMLLTEGSLRRMQEAPRRAAVQRVLDMVERGL